LRRRRKRAEVLTAAAALDLSAAAFLF